MVLPKISENLQKRVISAGILAPLIIGILWAGGALYTTLIAFAAVVMSFEWCAIVSSNAKDNIDESVRKKWQNYGLVYVGIFVASLLYLRSVEGGLGYMMLVLGIVWATDIAAYFAGSILKGPKIYPAISPNKTWSGLAGGMLAAGFVGVFSSAFINGAETVTMFVLGAFMAIVSQAGDFFESFVKRKFGVKDSGNIIPGHGGVLDRVDGLTTVVPLFSLFALFNGGSLF